MLKLIKSKTPIARKEYSQIRSILQKELDKFIKKYKRMPSKKEMLAKIRSIQLKLKDEMISAATSAYSVLYTKAALQVAQSIGDKLRLTSVDQNAIDHLSTQPVLRRSFAGLSREISEDLQELFEKAYQSDKGINPKKMRENIKRIADVSDFRAETIARTESAKISGTARYNQYKKREDFKDMLFKWVGPNDYRTTDLSKRIIARVGNGVTFEELYKIVSEESRKDFPEWRVDPNNLVSHYNSRHTFLKVGMKK